MVIDLSTLANKKDEHRILVLACKDCLTMEEVPVDERYPIKNQQDNPYLAIALEKHQRPQPHLGVLFDVDFAVWNSDTGRKQIHSQVLDGLGGGGLGQEIYAAKDNYSADAMKCFQVHLRPEGQCPDYKSGSKVIKVDIMKRERRDAGLSDEKLPSFYLCDFCPVKSFNMMKSNKERGLYK
jgi:hypothetical protein